MGFLANGALVWDYYQERNVMEAPKGSGAGTIFCGNLWMGAKDENGDLHLAANLYYQNGQELWPGPVANNYNAAYDLKYRRTWTIGKAEIDNHINNWNMPGYQMPEV